MKLTEAYSKNQPKMRKRKNQQSSKDIGPREKKMRRRRGDRRGEKRGRGLLKTMKRGRHQKIQLSPETKYKATGATAKNEKGGGV